jgi:hypothetical protein
MGMVRLITIIVIIFFTNFNANAQRIAVSANLADIANLGTLSGELSVAASRHISVNAGVRYNPWQYGSQEKGFIQNRKREASLGVRYWPWNIFSSWWFGMRTQVREYNCGGLFRRQITEEGIAVGAEAAFGYSYMIHSRFNIEFGAGIWGGHRWYTRYDCPRCGTILSEDNAHGWFVIPGELIVSLVYIF